jgi:hypothetical protein
MVSRTDENWSVFEKIDESNSDWFFLVYQKPVGYNKK